VLVGDEAEFAHALVLAGKHGGVEDVGVEGVALEQRLVAAVDAAVDVGHDVAAGRHG
jgi:hypothetical protein